MKFDEVKIFPVLVSLSTKNPWKGAVKVNNITITTTAKKRINSREEFDKLLPIAKYLVIELCEIKTEIKTEVKIESTEQEKEVVKKTRKKKVDS